MTVQIGKAYRRDQITDEEWEAHEWTEVYFVGMRETMFICGRYRPGARGDDEVIDARAWTLPDPGEEQP